MPFVVFAVGSAPGGTAGMWCTHALLAYGAVILSFVGALHWGFAMLAPDLTDARRGTAYLWSVVPALAGWAGLVLPSTAAGAAVLVAGFSLQYRMDVEMSRVSTLPGWYLPLRWRLTVVACLCLVGGVLVGRLTPAAHAADAPPHAGASAYREGAPSADGIGKYYQGREIARVMGFAGAAWLDRPTREVEERPDLLVDELHLAPGMTVADIGAGSGYLTRRLAPPVAPGRVFAVDVQPEMIGLLRELVGQPGLGNIVPVLAAADDAKLPPASVDLAVMVDVYHELEFPDEVMRSIVTSLKRGGRLVLVEYRAEDPRVPIKALHKMGESQVRLEMRHFPLTWERTSERLPLQHLIVFRKDSP